MKRTIVALVIAAVAAMTTNPARAQDALGSGIPGTDEESTPLPEIKLGVPTPEPITAKPGALTVQVVVALAARKVPISAKKIEGWLLATCLRQVTANGGECAFDEKLENGTPTDFVITTTLHQSGKGGLVVAIDWAERGNKPSVPMTKTFAKPTDSDVRKFVDATVPVITAGMVSLIEERSRAQATPADEPEVGLVATGNADAQTAEPKTNAPGSATTATARTPVTPNWPWYVAGVAGAAALGLGTFAYLTAEEIKTAQRDFDYATRQVDAEAARARGDDARKRATYIGVGAIGTGVIGVTFAVLQLTGAFDREAEVRITAASGGAEATLGGRF